MFFQAERLLAVFLYEKLQKLCSILKRFIRSEELDENTTPTKLMAVDLNNKKISYQLHQSLLELGQERSWINCQQHKIQIIKLSMLLQYVKKIYEQYPLKYFLTRALSSLSLLQIKVGSNSVLKIFLISW